MKKMKKILIALILAVSILGTVGCEEKGPAEKAGEKLDKAAEDAAKKMNDLLGK